MSLDIELRKQRGESADFADYVVRFPQLADQALSDAADIPLPSKTSSTPLLPQRYEPLKPVGRGGLGVVWRVRDRNLGRTLALKVVRDELRLDPETNARLRSEAAIMGGLQHPGIPPVVERGELVTGISFFSMKLVEGSDLAAIYRRRKSLTERRTELVEVLLQVSEATAFAHQRGVIHCDLKPHNVMVGEFGEVQLMDWGMARYFDQSPQSEVSPAAAANSEAVTPIPVEGDTRLNSDPDPTTGNGSATRQGQVMGSPGYMAPEQVRGERHRTDPCTDVYALAAILYEMLTGQPPAVGKDSKETLERARQGRPPGVLELQPRAPKDLAAVCMKGLAW